ncbi:MAG: peroxiredoxin [Desulfobulbaceae bacterium]|nr:MAG: peroxiredoxin [Desulfobulbaceae bacterium]
MRAFIGLTTLLILFFSTYPLFAGGNPVICNLDDKSSKVSKLLYEPGKLKPIDSVLQVQVGQMAPDFSLPSIDGKQFSLSSFRGQSNVVLSFIPAAWTPVCSGQWPGYNIVMKMFEQHDAKLFGISVDNIPTLHAWTQQIGGMKFDILSDFWPHGGVAQQYGVLRSDGTAERALFFINKEGVLTGILVSDINIRPPLEDIFKELQKFTQ